jgi:hypothetical protein
MRGFIKRHVGAKLRWRRGLSAASILVIGCCLPENTLDAQGAYTTRSHFATMGGSLSAEKYSGKVVVSTGVSIDEVSGGNVQSIAGAGPELVTQLGLTSTFSGPAPGIFSFGRSEFIVNENGSRVVPITVVRSGGAGGDVSVIVTPSSFPNEAFAGFDFSSTPVVLAFRDGNLVHEAVIPIIDDGRHEPNERINLTLSLAPSAPAQAGIGALNSAVVTIRDNDENFAPVISEISDQNISEDELLLELPFVISDQETSANLLTLSLESSNLELVPRSRMTVIGSGSNRALSVLPNPNAFGQAVISVIVDDGLRETRETFVLSVASVNDLPMIESLLDVTVLEDSGVHTFPIVVGDLESPASALIVTARSDNPNLVDEQGLSLGGNGATRTLDVVSKSNVLGASVIAVEVSDGVDSFSQSFQFSVLSVNDPPVLETPLAATVMEDEVLIAKVLVTDIDTLPSQLLIESLTATPESLFPSNALSWVAVEGGFEIRGTPARDQSGEAILTLRVTDQTSAVEAQFSVTVEEVNDSPFFGDLDAVSLDEDASIVLDLEIEDVESNIENLVVSVESLSESLLPLAGLSLEGTGSGRQLRIEPVANQFGEGTLVLLLGDGETTTELRVPVTVLSVDDAPFIGDLAPIEMLEDTETVVEFEFGDLDTAAVRLVLMGSVVSGDLFAADGLLLEGTPPTGRLRLRPNKDQNGEGVIQISVSDGTSVVERLIPISVASVMDPPRVSLIEDVVMDANETLSVRFEVFDPDSETDRLILDVASTNRELFSDETLRVEGAGPERTLQLKPSVGQDGEATILIGLSNGESSVSSRFKVTVLPGELPIPAPPERVEMQIERDGEALVIRWGGEGILQASSGILGPYFSVAGAINPYRANIAEPGNLYFRVMSKDGPEDPLPTAARIEWSPEGLLIRWDGAGALEEASELSGPYIPIEDATSPYQVPQPWGQFQFYRIGQP